MKGVDIPGDGSQALAGVRIGMVGLDTSHPAAFLPLLNDLGASVTAVQDAPASSLAADFARQHGVPHVVTDDGALAEHCDVVLLLGRDWDARLHRIDGLLDAGLGVCVDKPLAGRREDLEHLARLAEGGAPLSGGSSLRFADEALAWRRRHRGVPVTELSVGTGGHPLYYGVHAVSLALALLGDGLHAVRADVGADGFCGTLRHSCGTEVRVEVRPPGSNPAFHARITTGHGVEEIVPDAGGLYAPYLSAVLPFVAGRAPAPISPRGLVEPELALLALAWSAQRPGAWVELDEPPAAWMPWEGARFAADGGSSAGR